MSFVLAKMVAMDFLILQAGEVSKDCSHYFMAFCWYSSTDPRGGTLTLCAKLLDLGDKMMCHKNPNGARVALPLI